MERMSVMRKRTSNYKLYKAVTAFIIVFAMMVSVLSVPVGANAQTDEAVSEEVAGSDVMDVQSVEVSRIAVLQGKLKRSFLGNGAPGSSALVTVDDRNWQLYRTTYVFDQMDAKEKALYNALESVCMDFAKSSDKDALNIKDKSGNSAYYLPAVSISDFDDKSFVDVIQLFIYSNPQYYFTTSSYAVNGSDLYLFCYPEFAKGSERAKVTNKLFSTLDSWIEEIKADSKSNVDIEKRAHDFLCNQISYDYDAVEQMNAGNYSGDAYYSQSIYSAITKNKSVCAGYSLTFELLMNAAGVPTVTAYSDYHAWNKVYLGGNNWYAVDVTWDDVDDSSRIDYSFYNKSDDNIKLYDDELPVHEVKLPKYYPAAVKDYSADDITDIEDNEEAEEADEAEETEEADVEDTEESDQADKQLDETEALEEQTSSSEQQIDSSKQDEASSEDEVYDKGKADQKEDAAVAEVQEKELTPVQETENDKDSSQSDKLKEKFDLVPTPVKSSEEKQEVKQDNEKTKVVDNVSADAQTEGSQETVDTEVEKLSAASIKKLKAGSRKCKITWKKIKNIDGYEIQLSTTKNFKKIARKVKVSKSASSATVKSLKKKTTYYVRIRTFKNANGEKLMSEWSGVKKVAVK